MNVVNVVNVVGKMGLAAGCKLPWRSMLWAWADALGPSGSAPAKVGAVALAECGEVFLASDGGREEPPPALVMSFRMMGDTW